MSKPILLNLDWGSYYLKASARMYHHRVLSPVGPSWQLAGKSVGTKVEGHQSLRHSTEFSLKSAFLGARIPESALLSHNSAAEAQIADWIIKPLLKKIHTYHPNGGEIHLNIHTPLQMEDPSNVDHQIFQMVDAQKRLVGLRYEAPEVWRRASSLPGANRELVWGTWLMDRLIAGLDGQPELSLRVAMLPEALACVYELVGSLDHNEDVQLVVLDIGDFTTDFALVFARDMHGDQRMAVRQAGSIYDTGHQVIKKFGFQLWLDRLMSAIHRRFDASHLQRGVQPYCNLGILPVGGGAASLSPSQLEALRRRMEEWAGRRSHFLEQHKAYLVFPTRRSEAFQVLGDPRSKTLDMQTTDLTVHIPSRNACVFADTTLSLRVAGQGALATCG